MLFLKEKRDGHLTKEVRLFTSFVSKTTKRSVYAI